MSAQLSGLRLSLSMFTVLPVRYRGDIDRHDAGAAMLWLPIIGAGLGAVAAVPALLLADHATLVGAVLAVVVLALLTRGLHLDGLADLVDGLGSRKPADEALTIMRRSDIGPFGVVALVLALLLQVSSVASVAAGDDWQRTLAVVVAASVTGRLTALWAAGPAVPSARPGGFGSLVVGSVTPTGQLLQTVLVLAGSVIAGGLLSAFWLPVAVGIGLLLGWIVRAHAVGRLGGVTGDVFGALIEITTTTVLLATAIGATWP